MAQGWTIVSEDGRELDVDVTVDDKGVSWVVVDDPPAAARMRFSVQAAEQLRAVLGAAIGQAQHEDER